MRIWLAIAAIWTGSAHAASQEDVNALMSCLALQDVVCAEDVVQTAGFLVDDEPVFRAIAAEVAFSAGDYVLAVERMERAVSEGFDDPRDDLALYRRTLHATAGWVEEARGHFRLRYRPGIDAVLLDGAVDALQATDELVSPLLGATPPGSTIVELYPDGRSFVAASSLTPDDVSSTGVVAISKWTRLLVTSPRARALGYSWQATLSHEYIHLVVAHNTADEAPVWLQEAIAKYLDGRWARAAEDFVLPVQSQGYLADALEEGELVPFDEMHPSLAKIKVFAPDGGIDKAASARRAALAYAQLATIMQYAFERGGDQVLRRTLPAVAEGTDPRVALADAVGASSWSAFLSDWEAWIRSQTLAHRDVSPMPTVLDGGEAADADPVMSRRRDLANFVRLGELLHDRGRYRAALVEYDKARDDEDPNSPLLANRMAATHLAMGDGTKARGLLRAVLADYPDHALTLRSLGFLLRQQGELSEAIGHLSTSLASQPFSVEAREALVDLHTRTGDADAAAAEEATLRILRRGGTDRELPPIHERYGEYIFEPEPKAEQAGPPVADIRTALEGSKAPDFDVQRLEGGMLGLAELRGRVVILDFWATWCGPCRAIMPHLSDLAEDYEEDGLTVIGISNETTSTVRRFLETAERRGQPFAQVMALEGGEVRRAYGVSSIPMLVVIDRSGTVRLVHVGSGDMDEVDRLVARLLGKTTEEVIP